MELLPKEIKEHLPKLYSTEHIPVEDKIALVKFFYPAGRYTFYAVEFDPNSEIFFGYCVSPLGSDCDEWGYTSLEEMQSVNVRGLGIERDFAFVPTKMKTIFDYWNRTRKI